METSTFGNICIWKNHVEVLSHTYSDETHVLSITFPGRTIYLQKVDR